MDFFCSDLHIGHDKEFLYGPRGFSSIEEHDTAILERWNATVSQEDTVYILGDLCMNNNEREWHRIFSALNGHKKMVMGNHDTPHKIRFYEIYGITSLGFASLYKHSGHKSFYLSHYPTMV